jgi:hypothetical protein
LIYYAIELHQNRRSNFLSADADPVQKGASVSIAPFTWTVRISLEFVAIANVALRRLRDRAPFSAFMNVARRRTQDLAPSTWLPRIWLVFVAVINVVRRRLEQFVESIRKWVVSGRMGNKTIEIDAWDVVEKYGATLRSPPKYSVSLIRDVSELTYPKAAIKAVLQDALQRFPPIDALKTAYISLADFQELTDEETNALAATSGLGLISSSVACLEGVYSRREKEQSDLVQELKSLGVCAENLIRID